MNTIRSSIRSNFWWRTALVLSGFLMTALAAVAQHTAVSTLLPAGYHSEEALTWCGPATGQMIVAGYPTSACTVVQADVDASIQTHKVEGNWDTDPAGLRASFADVCPLPSAHWVAITAIVTDVNPVGNPTVNLQFVQFIDPSPTNLGDPPMVRFVTGAQWS